MPFGARASSCFMQRVANFITRVLRGEGIEAIMYLEDVVVVAPDLATATTQYNRVKALFDELGLPEAIDKAQPPSKVVRWLGVQVDAGEMTLSIPRDKVEAALVMLAKYRSVKTISKRQLQSLIGTLVHVAKCVESARVFISRLLQALRRCGDRWYMKVTEDMGADMDWFLEFLQQWNGVSLIPSPDPHKIIQVDACLTGVGASDGPAAYAARIAPDTDPVDNITEIEAANIVIALHTFLTDDDAGGHVMIYCDNLPSVQALTSGRAQNPVLAECARSIWMLQAKYAIKISYSHIAGQDNKVADALSRAHTSRAHNALAREFIDTLRLIVVYPCTHILSNLHPPLLSRSGVELAGRPSGGATGSGPSTWDQGRSTHNCVGDASLLSQIPNEHDRDGGVHVGRVLGHKAPATIKNKVSHARGYMRLADASLIGFNHIRVSRALDAVSRRKDHVSVVKDAIPAQILRAALQAMSNDHNGLMMRAAVLLMFYGALRQSEVAPPSIKAFNPLVHLTRADVSLQEKLTVTIKAGKNLQRHDQRKTSTLSPTGDPLTCPLKTVRAVLQATPDLPQDAPLLIFVDGTTPIPTSYLRAEWARIMRSIGADHTIYSLHSLRKASATKAHSGGCSELEVQRHGGWSSSAYLTYIQTDTHRVNDVLSQSLN